jgi:hypothetical protein
MRGWRWLAVAAACALAACGPNLSGLEKGERGKVERAFTTGFEMDSGLLVYLAEIDAPRGDAPYARQAMAELEALAAHRDVQLGYGGQTRMPDRLDENGEPMPERAIAHVFVRSEGGGWSWLQHQLVSRGAAFVRPRAENHARVVELFAAETQARDAKRGLWADANYHTRTPREAANEAREMTLRCQDRGAPLRFVEGVIEGIDVQERRAVFQFAGGSESEPALAIVVFGRGFANWRGPGFSTYEGKRIRVRGQLENFRFRNAPAEEPGRPQICIDDAGQIEMLDAKR